ncbi:MAG: 30S ribosomal protein S6 [Thermoanaerobaculia bacterium]
MRTYELMFVVDPRLPDEEVVSLADSYREMLSGQGGKVTGEESWGKRKLAYPIEKLTEGTYHLFYVSAEEENPFPEVERRMQQNEKVLRYLTVRTDEGRLRYRERPEESPAPAPATGEEESR